MYKETEFWRGHNKLYYSVAVSRTARGGCLFPGLSLLGSQRQGCQIRVAGGEELVGAAFVGSTDNELPTNATVPVAGCHGCGEVPSPKNHDRIRQGFAENAVVDPLVAGVLKGGECWEQDPFGYGLRIHCQHCRQNEK